MNALNKSDPWLSVIMPTYNGEKYISYALDSIVAQNDNCVECVIIDDGSEDNTVRIAQSYINKLNLKIIQIARTGNWVKNTNFGLSLARANFACLLHQDDAWKPARLQKMRYLIKAYPACSLFFHSARFINDKGKDIGLWSCPVESYPKVLSGDKLLERLIVQDSIAINAPIFRRATVIAAGGLNESLWYSADWDLWLRLAHSGKIIYLREALSEFRVHPNSQTIKRSLENGSYRIQQEIVLKEHLSRNIFFSKVVVQAAFYSITLNTALASAYHGRWFKLLYAMADFVALGPYGWKVYIQYSRIFERVIARLRARV